MNEAVLALGTNLGDREKNINNAILAIKNLPDTEVLGMSSIYETEPFGVPDKQENYLNCCVKIKTGLPAEILLGSALGIESAMGRVRKYDKAPRIIDIDLLLYEGAKIEANHIVVPHPRIRERAFVMVPLADIYPSKSAVGFDFEESLEKIKIDGVIKFK